MTHRTVKNVMCCFREHVSLWSETQATR